jgi:hypothetical protein
LNRKDLFVRINKKYKGDFRTMKPIEIRLQNAYSNIGIQESPMICWKYGNDCGRRVQKACRIQILDGENTVFDSGILETQKQTEYLCDCKLESHKLYKVIVEILDSTDIWEMGEIYEFISGVTADQWKGSWISNGTGKPHYLGRNFSLEKKIVSAVISVVGVGQYRMTINGQTADDSVLNGSWTDFNKHIHYQTYDVTALLKQENEVLIEVGNGWYLADLEDSRHFYTKHAKTFHKTQRDCPLEGVLGWRISNVPGARCNTAWQCSSRGCCGHFLFFIPTDYTDYLCHPWHLWAVSFSSPTDLTDCH